MPDGVDGKSLLPIYSKPSAEVREHLALVNVWGPRPVHSLAVVTKEWKYIHWPYKEEKFKQTEELYHIAKDPLELKNLASEKSSDQSKEAMRILYDNYVAMWKREAVPYHRYAEFGDFFERTIASE